MTTPPSRGVVTYCTAVGKPRLIPPRDRGIIMNVLTDYYDYTDKGLGRKEFDRVERRRWPSLREEERLMPTIEFTIDKVNRKIDEAKRVAMQEGRQEGRQEGGWRQLYAC